MVGWVDTEEGLSQEKILLKLIEVLRTLQDILQKILLLQSLHKNVKFNLLMQLE
jgi:hypothetical protein